MNSQKLKSYLEVGTSVAVIIVAVVVLTVFARQMFKQEPSLQLQPGLQKGVTLRLEPLTLKNEQRQTLIVAMSTRCEYCTESIPFLNELAETQQKGNRQTTILAIFPDSEKVVREYTQREQLKLTALAPIDLKSFNVQGTPTIILVDSAGRVLDFWIGKLSSEEQQQVIKVLGLDRLLVRRLVRS